MFQQGKNSLRVRPRLMAKAMASIGDRANNGARSKSTVNVKSGTGELGDSFVRVTSCITARPRSRCKACVLPVCISVRIKFRITIRVRFHAHFMLVTGVI